MCEPHFPLPSNLFYVAVTLWMGNENILFLFKGIRKRIFKTAQLPLKHLDGQISKRVLPSAYPPELLDNGYVKHKGSAQIFQTGAVV